MQWAAHFQKANLEQHKQNAVNPQKPTHRKRKRSQDTEEPQDRISTKELGKRARTSAGGAVIEDTSIQDEARIASEGTRDPLVYWSRHGRWPKEYFEEGFGMSYLLARKRSATSLRRKKSDPSLATSSSSTPSDEKQREAKSAEYNDARYETLLATKSSFMFNDKGGPKKKSKDLCRMELLGVHQNVPEISRFSDEVFESTCRRIQGRNEAKVVQDIARLIVPSVEEFADFGADHLENLVESVNEGWNNCIPVTKTRPQPDYAVGFKREAFTKDQLNKIQPILGELTDMSYFMATYYMYFPFLTCEVKCGAAALDIADRQNAHSMTLAVRAVVELFKLAKREKEVDREVLAFSISHDHRTVRIYGHYAVLDEGETKYYRHLIHEFSFTALDGKEKWTAYKFTKNVYDIWMPMHFRRICSVINEFPPDINFALSQESELRFPEESGLSQDLETYSLTQSSVGSASVQAQADDHSNVVDTQDLTPNTSLTESRTFKRPRKENGSKKRR